MAVTEGKTAPAFTLEDADGKPVALADFAGALRGRLFLPEGRHAGLHQGGLRLP